jgi:hypothetical protein
MADDTVASLGFAVDSKPLDEAKVKLKDLGTQAKDTGQAVDDFNQKASKTGTNLGAGPKQLAAGLTEAEQAAAKAGTSLGVLESMARRSGVSIGEMATRVAAARVGMSATAVASAELGTALNVVAPAAEKAAVAVAAKSISMRDLNLALRTASPLLNEFDSGLGRLLSSSTRVRGSIAVLGAVVAGELTIAFTKAADQITRNKQLFDAITGSSVSGSAALDKVKLTASAAGLEFSTMAGAIQKAAQGQAEFASRTVIYANSADQAGKNIGKLTDGFGTLGKIMQLAGATGKEEATVFDVISSSIQKTGGLTADAFQRIRDSSLPTARAISNAFGFKDIEEFQRQIERTPISLDDLLRRLALVAPAVDEAFKSGDRIKTFEQSTRELGIEWNRLLETLAQIGAFNAVVSAISGVTAALNVAAYAAEKLGPALKQIGTTTVNGGGGQFNNADPMGTFNPYGSDPYGNSTDPSNNIVAGFASGGSFVVGGSGGTDSQAVTFKATPGEIVTIATPDQAASGIASLTPAPGSTTDIEELLKDQTKAIVDAINGLKTTSAVTTAATTAVAAVAASGGGGGVPSFGTGGAAGSGAAAGGNPFKKLEDELKKQDSELAARERELGGGGNFAGGSAGVSGLTRGQAAPIYGFRDSRSASFPTRTPTGQYSPFGIGAATSGPDKGLIRVPQVERNTREANSKLDELGRSTDETTRKVETGAQDTVQVVESGARDTVSAIDASSSTIAAAIAAGFGDIGMALAAMGREGGGGSSGGSGGAGGSGSNDSSSGYGGYNPSSDPFGAPMTPSYNGSSSFDEGGFNSAFNPGSFDSSGSSSFDEAGFEGSFAKGGQFTVGGDGGIDTTPVKLFATRGEQVTITPPGIRVPPSMLRPGGSGAGSSSRTVQHVTHKNVTINVQAGISSETFLRSRAQIQRAS